MGVVKLIWSLGKFYRLNELLGLEGVWWVFGVVWWVFGGCLE